MTKPIHHCGQKLANGCTCTRPASPKSALGSCELHRRRALYVAWSEGWPMAIPLSLRLMAEEGSE